MQDNTPAITVVIATYNRSTSLKETLTALQQQDFNYTKFEVIVVNDGSTDNTLQILEAFKNVAPFRFNYFTQANRGPAAARNKGIEQALGSIIAFTDDDCIPDYNWISTIYHSFELSHWVGVQGSTYTDVSKITPLTHQIDNSQGNASVPTCNAAYLRSVLLAVSGFDESFPFPHNEDADLAWRVNKLGTIGFEAQMRVYHPVRTDSFKKVASRMKILESEFRLFAKHPRAYRMYRAASPWLNIYWEIGIKTQLYYLHHRIKFLNRPTLFIKGIALTLLWWVDLIKLYPKFIKAHQKQVDNLA
jgi:glycosyltransferase involved in cell wall biosynthesis